MGCTSKGYGYISPLLAAYVGESVILRYDPRDVAEIQVFHRGQHICKAVDPTHERSIMTFKDIQKARSARKRQLRGQINERIATVAEFLPAGQPTTEAPQPDPAVHRTKKTKLRTYAEDE